MKITKIQINALCNKIDKILNGEIDIYNDDEELFANEMKNTLKELYAQYEEEKLSHYKDILNMRAKVRKMLSIARESSIYDDGMIELKELREIWRDLNAN